MSRRQLLHRHGGFVRPLQRRLVPIRLWRNLVRVVRRGPVRFDFGIEQLYHLRCGIVPEWGWQVDVCGVRLGHVLCFYGRVDVAGLLKLPNGLLLCSSCCCCMCQLRARDHGCQRGRDQLRGVLFGFLLCNGRERVYELRGGHLPGE